MAVTFQGINGNPAGLSPQSPAMPSGVVAGDALVSMAIGNVGSSQVFSVSAGWTLIEQPAIVGKHGVAMAVRVATGSGDQPTWSWSQGGTANTNVSRYNGTNPTSPFGNHSSKSGSGTAASGTAITTTANNSLVVDDTNSNTAGTIPVPTSYTSLNNSTPAPSERISGLLVATSGGSSGTVAVTVASGDWTVFLLELKVAASANPRSFGAIIG